MYFSPITRELALNENEKAVLSALLEFKFAQKTAVIARKAELPRTTTLYILRRFEMRKLARRIFMNARNGEPSKCARWAYIIGYWARNPLPETPRRRTSHHRTRLE